MLDCSDIIHKHYINDIDELTYLETKLKMLFENTIDVHSKEITRPSYDINESRRSKGSTRDALWFGKAEYDNKNDSEFWMPLYRIPTSNFNKADPREKNAASIQAGSFDRQLRRLDGDYEWLMDVLNRISESFGLKDKFKLNHCVVHRYMGKDDNPRQVNEAPDRFNFHHDKILDLNLHHLLLNC